MSELILGIDPGMSGGAALISKDGKFIQVMAFKRLSPPEVAQWLFNHKEEIAAAYLEGVGARPTDGVVPAFKFGQNYGMWHGFLAAAGLTFKLVYPLKWQTALRCRTGGNKNISKAAAQKLFPHIKVTHQIADCLLIAEYGRRLATGENDL